MAGGRAETRTTKAISKSGGFGECSQGRGVGLVEKEGRWTLQRASPSRGTHL